MMSSILLLVIATIVSIILAYTQWRKEIEETDDITKRQSSKKIFFLSVLSSLVACIVGFIAIIDQNLADAKAEKYRVKFEKKQNEVLKLSRQIRDSTGKTLQGYVKLEKAQSQIILLQNSTIEQITGGKNKPILIGDFQLT